MCAINDTPYQVRSAVLFVIFNRPDTTNLVFNEIRKAKPQRLYIGADAARSGRPGETLLCEQARSVINKVDWDCEVKTLFQGRNLGCRAGVPTALDWFFENEQEGIILEDDCLPANSFFKFCDVMLDRYRDNSAIRHITGCNLQFGKKWGADSYYFSNRSHVWGWASWKRVWQDYDKSLSKYDVAEFTAKIRTIYRDDFVADCWADIFTEVKAGRINAWAYQLDIGNFFKNGLTIIPNQNLISNIGFGKAATHTIDENSPYANIPLEEMVGIVHPATIIPQPEADKVIFYRDFRAVEKERKNLTIKEKIRKWYQKIISNPN